MSKITYDQVPDEMIETDQQYSDRTWFPVLRKSKFMELDLEYQKLRKFLIDSCLSETTLEWYEEYCDFTVYKLNLKTVHFKIDICYDCGTISEIPTFEGIIEAISLEFPAVDDVHGVVRTPKRYCTCIEDDPEKRVTEPGFLFVMEPNYDNQYVSFLELNDFGILKKIVRCQKAIRRYLQKRRNLICNQSHFPLEIWKMILSY